MCMCECMCVCGGGASTPMLQTHNTTARKPAHHNAVHAVLPNVARLIPGAGVHGSPAISRHGDASGTGAWTTPRTHGRARGQGSFQRYPSLRTDAGSSPRRVNYYIHTPPSAFIPLSTPPPGGSTYPVENMPLGTNALVVTLNDTDVENATPNMSVTPTSRVCRNRLQYQAAGVGCTTMAPVSGAISSLHCKHRGGEVPSGPLVPFQYPAALQDRKGHEVAP